MVWKWKKKRVGVYLFFFLLLFSPLYYVRTCMHWRFASQRLLLLFLLLLLPSVTLPLLLSYSSSSTLPLSLPHDGDDDDTTSLDKRACSPFLFLHDSSSSSSSDPGGIRFCGQVPQNKCNQWRKRATTFFVVAPLPSSFFSFSAEMVMKKIWKCVDRRSEKREKDPLDGSISGTAARRTEREGKKISRPSVYLEWNEPEGK